jgi:hypothetical protein
VQKKSFAAAFVSLLIKVQISLGSANVSRALLEGLRLAVTLFVLFSFSHPQLN